MLADFHPKGQVSKLYGVYNEERGTANRAVVIVDRQGIVRFSRVYTSMSELDTADVLAEIGKL